MRRAIMAVGFAVLATPAFAAAGLGIDTGAPIAVNADSFTADINGGSGTYTGNVLVVQGAVKLHADEVTVTANDAKASRMEAKGHVVLDSPAGTAVGDSAVYDTAGQVVRMVGHVVLTKDKNVLRGTALEVQVTTGRASLTGGTGTAQNPAQGRVQGLFVPGQQAAPAPATP